MKKVKLIIVILIFLSSISCNSSSNQDKNYFVRYRDKEKYGICDINKKMIVQPQFDYLYLDTINFPIEVKGKWGLIDSNGNKIVAPIYDLILSSNGNGIRAVKLKGKWGFINKAGKEITKCKYDQIFNIEKDVLGRTSGHFIQIGNSTEYVDANNKPLETYNNSNGPLFDGYEKYFFNGLCQIWLNNKCGFINMKGEEVIPCIYEDSKPFSEGLAAVERKDKWGFIDTAGKLVIPFNLYDANSFQNGRALVEIDYKIKDTIKGGKYISYSRYEDGVLVDQEETVIPKKITTFNEEGLGFINKEGKIVTPCLGYSDVKEFSNNLANVEKDYKWGFIDTMGKLVIPCLYDYMPNHFLNNFAPFSLDSKTGMLNIKGEQVIPNIYDFVIGIRPLTGDNGLLVIVSNKKWGFIDTTGQIKIPCIYQYCSPFRNGFAAVKKNDKWGCIDIDNKIVIPIIYDDITGIDKDGFVIVTIDGRRSTLNKNGKQYWNN